MKTSKELEELIDQQTADYATKFYGKLEEEERQYKESLQETHRTRFRRDRDRILYSTAFRRLQFKTQVFVNSTGDHFRTRLTHSMEVEQLANSVAQALNLNEDLVSAIAYGHDLGHTPFGHAVESALNELMAECGGYAHHVQSIRVVELLEKYRDGYSGLNLCKSVREGIFKHTHEKYDNFQQHDCSHLSLNNPGSLEAQVVYNCDKLAYVTHDLDDAVRSGLLHDLIKKREIDINEVMGLWNDFGLNFEIHVTRDLIRVLLDDIIKGSSKNLNEAQKKGKLNSVEDVRNWDYVEPLLAFKNFELPFKNLKNFLTEKIYKCKYNLENDNKAQEMVKVLFERFITDNGLLPKETQKKIEDKCICPKRVIADHIAGMTDRYASYKFKQIYLFTPYDAKWRHSSE